MKSKNTIIWLLVLISLGAFAYYYEVIEGKKQQQTKEALEKIYTLPAAGQVEAVKIINNGVTVRCVKDNSGKWLIMEPLKVAADATVVQDVISTVLDTKIQRVLEEKIPDLEGYGLKDKALTVTLTAGKQDYSLLLGELNPTGAFVYCKRDKDNKVFMLFANIRQHLDKELYDMRDKKVISAPAQQIKTLSLKYQLETIILSHQITGDKWQITQPLNVLADNKELNSYIELLNTVPIKRFVAEETTELAQYGLDQPQIIIDITMNNDTHQTLLLGKKNEAENEMFAKLQDKGSVFTLPLEIEKYLFKKAPDFRNKNLVAFSTDELSGLELISPQQNIVLERQKVTYSFQWMMLKPEKVKAKDTVVYDILNNLLQLQVKEFVDQPDAKTDYGFKQPALKISISFSSKQQSNLSLTFGAKKATTGLIYVQVNDKIVLVDAAILGQIDKKPADFKSL